MAAARNMQWAQLSQIRAGVCSSDLPCALDGLLQPVLLDSILIVSSNSMFASAIFWKGMADQLCCFFYE